MIMTIVLSRFHYLAVSEFGGVAPLAGMMFDEIWLVYLPKWATRLVRVKAMVGPRCQTKMILEMKAKGSGTRRVMIARGFEETALAKKIPIELETLVCKSCSDLHLATELTLKKTKC